MRASFLQAIIASPEDDAPRLVFADWIEEHGEPERAEFIRVQCELARLPEPIGERTAHNNSPWAKRAAYYDALRRREMELIGGRATQIGIDTTAIWPIEWCRGFAESITCAWDDWLTNADAIRAMTPLREVRLTTWPRTTADFRFRVGYLLGDELSRQWPSIRFILSSAAWSQRPSDPLSISGAVAPHIVWH